VEPDAISGVDDARDACLDSAMTRRELAKAGIVSHLEQQHLEITVVGK
jgi:hypothetical protein